MLTNFLAFATADPVATSLGLSDYFTTQISVLRILLTFGMAFAIGIFVFFIYKRTFNGVMYSRSLNISFIMLTLVTSLMLMLINNNLTLSLGMVGALSIIRFRTAVKDPIDTVYMFWAVGEGIAVGTGFFIEAIIAAVVIGIILVILNVFRLNGPDTYLLIIHYDESASSSVKQLMKQLPKYRVKSKSVTSNGVELTLELSLKQNELGFVEKLASVEGIYDAMLISHQGDIVA